MKSMSDQKQYDLLIIGGGINGAGIAADASGRGLSVVLCEQGDLASATSSWSSKLIHGGLRYLENYEFRLVKEALREREVLLNSAPHLIHPLRITLPHNKHCRPRWMIRAGLFLYDHLDRKQTLPKSTTLRIQDAESEPLKPMNKVAYQYSDGAVDDSRLVVSNAQMAQEKGADIFTRHRVLKAERHNDVWQITVKDRRHQTEKTLYAKAIVNAAGPWVDEVIGQRLAVETQHHVRLIKGSHLVVPKFYDGDHGYILQHSDQRIVFVLPFQTDFVLIGTTDVPYQGDPAKVAISADEQDYLLDIVNHYFKHTLTPEDVVWSFSGVRPLQEDKHGDPSKVTRDYTFEVDDQQGKLPVLSIFGGKITTYRKLAEHALERLNVYFPEMGPAWTADMTLPGGDIQNYDAFCQQQAKRFAWLPEPMLTRLCKAYGTHMVNVIGDATSTKELGVHFGGTLYEKEVRFLIEQEWAQKAADIVWRRTKQGLHMRTSQIQQLHLWLKAEGFLPDTQP